MDLDLSFGVSQELPPPDDNGKAKGKEASPPSKAPSPNGLRAKIARRFSSSQTSPDRSLREDNQLDSPAFQGAQWQRALKKVMHAQRMQAISFHRARRQNAIHKEDRPGVYNVKVAHTGEIRVRNPSLVKLVAIHQRTEFEIVHSTIAQHTLTWSSLITDPEGNELPSGSINLYRYPMVQFDDKDHFWDKRNQTTEAYGSQARPTASFPAVRAAPRRRRERHPRSAPPTPSASGNARAAWMRRCSRRAAIDDALTGASFTA